ncbi:hypothetical protein J6590_061428 [Homalodisca vitripennis]|nr:hypothetical protein J6590_061428 [Homalodisca vitripennis]
MSMKACLNTGSNLMHLDGYNLYRSQNSLNQSDNNGLERRSSCLRVIAAPTSILPASLRQLVVTLLIGQTTTSFSFLLATF